MSPYAEILANRSFALFWGGFTLSNVGDSMSWVALVWLVFETTGSSEQVGLLLFLYSAPTVLGGLAAGVLLDRFDRRRLMIADNLVRAVVFAAIPVLSALHLLRLWQIGVVAAIYGSLLMVTIAGGPAIVPSLVARHQLATANALESIGFSAGEIVGRWAAGLLLVVMPAVDILLLDCCTYLIFALCLLRLRVPAPPTAPADRPTGSALESVGSGFRFIVATRALLWISVAFIVVNLGAGALGVVMPQLAEALPSGGARLFGLLMMSLSLGQLAGSLAVGALRWRLPLRRSIAVALVLAASVLPWVAVAPDGARAALVLAGFGLLFAPVNVWAQTVRMELIPAPLRGRVFSVIRTSVRSTLPLSAALAGFVMPQLGIELTVALMALLIGAPGAIALASGAFEPARVRSR